RELDPGHEERERDADQRRAEHRGEGDPRRVPQREQVRRPREVEEARVVVEREPAGGVGERAREHPERRPGDQGEQDEERRDEQRRPERPGGQEPSRSSGFTSASQRFIHSSAWREANSASTGSGRNAYSACQAGSASAGTSSRTRI